MSAILLDQIHSTGVVPAGTHVLDTTLLPRPGAVIRGEGAGRTTLQFTGTEPAVWAKSGRVHLQDLTIDGARQSLGAYGLRVGDTGSCQLTAERVFVKRFGTAGVHLKAGQGVTFRDCEITDCQGVGMLVDNTVKNANVDIVLDRTHLLRNVSTQMQVKSVLGLTLRGCRFEAGQSGGLALGMTVVDDNFRNIVLDRCYFEGNGGEHLTATSATNAIIRDLEVRRCYFLSSGGTYGLTFGGARAFMWFNEIVNDTVRLDGHSHPNAATHLHDERVPSYVSLEDDTVAAFATFYGPGGEASYSNVAGTLVA